MQKVFDGKQSGIFAATAELIKSRLPDIELHVEVEGIYIITRKALNGPFRGVYVSGRREGYVRNITIASGDGRHYSVAVDHGVEEDIGATGVIFTYYPKLSLDKALKGYSETHDDLTMSHTIDDIVIAFDNSDSEQQKMLVGFLKKHKSLASHSSPQVRSTLTLLAKQLKSSEARNIILRSLEDPDDSVRKMALMNLEADGELLGRDKIEDLLLENLHSDSRDIRAYASEDLGAYGTAKAVPQLLKMACDPDDYVREAALIAIHRLIKEQDVVLSASSKRKSIDICTEVLGETERYILKAAALRLLFEADTKKRKALEEAFKHITTEIDVFGSDATFKAQLFYRSNLWSLLVENIKWLVEHREYAAELTNAIQMLTEDVKHLYEKRREASWSSYLRRHDQPPRKAQGQVFVDFDHDSTVFEQALHEIQPELAGHGIKLFISKDHNPESSENVFIPKVYRPIQESEFMLVDVSRSNLNVGYELGLAEKFNVPFALVAAQQTQEIPFDLVGHYVHLKYDTNSAEAMASFKKRLVQQLIKAFEGIRSKPTL